MSYKVSLSVNHAVIIAFIMGVIAALTYLIDQNAPITVTMVLMAIVTGITAALHYEQKPSAQSTTPPSTPPANTQTTAPTNFFRQKRRLMFLDLRK